MTDAINSNNRVRPQGPPTEQRTKTEARPGGDAVAGSSQASAVVELSSDQVLQQMRELPDVNSDRVQAIKNALANGEYRPDPEIIASKFAEIEKLLP